MPLFGKASRVNPVEVVKSLRDSLDTLDKSQDRKKVEKVIQCLVAIYLVEMLKLFYYSS